MSDIHPRITILIPVLNRAHTLRHTLRTCVRDGYAGLRILISDNLSDDNLAQMLTDFDDPRIEVVRPSQRLSMVEHWNFALGHVKSGYVIIIGADDGIIPGGITRLAKVIRQSGASAISWHLPFYLWPGTTAYFGSTPNSLDVSVGRGQESRESSKVLADVCAFESSYSELPGVYHRCLSTEILEKIKEKCGEYFSACCPDIYMALMSPLLVEQFVHLDEAVSINGISPSGNGYKFLSENSEGITKQLTDFLAGSKEYRDERFPAFTTLTMGVLETIEIANIQYRQWNRSLPRIVYKKAFSRALTEIGLTAKSDSEADDLLRRVQDTAKSLEQTRIFEWLMRIPRESILGPGKRKSVLEESAKLMPYLNPRRRAIRFQFEYLDNVYDAAIAFLTARQTLTALPRVVLNSVYLLFLRIRDLALPRQIKLKFPSAKQ